MAKPKADKVHGHDYQVGGTDSSFSLKDLKDTGIKHIKADDFTKHIPGHDISINLGFTDNGTDGAAPPPDTSRTNEPNPGGAPGGSLSTFLASFEQQGPNGHKLPKNVFQPEHGQATENNKGVFKDPGVNHHGDLKFPDVVLNVDDFTYGQITDDANPTHDLHVAKQLIALGIDFVHDSSTGDETNLHDWLKAHS